MTKRTNKSNKRVRSKCNTLEGRKGVVTNKRVIMREGPGGREGPRRGKGPRGGGVR